ncbi:MAG: methionyl-tRNA formyltransferase [Bacteroidia bacterium]
MRLVFMGTPDFAVASLDALVKAGHDVACVITAPDKPAGRGRKLSQSAVKKYAETQNLNVLQPEKLKNPEFLQNLEALNAELFVVVAFRMLPEVVWSMPPKGTFNLHGSLLPKYRGAAPINWAVINGENETGVTTFFLQHEIDTGDIIAQEKMRISEDDTAGSVHDNMMLIGADLVAKTVEMIESGNVSSMPQKIEGEIPHAPKIFREDCRVDWQQSLNTIYNKIRGLSPYPGAWSMLDGKTFKLLKVRKQDEKHNFDNGACVADKHELKIACLGGLLIVDELQLEGKKRMKADEFLRGFDIENKKLI